MSFQRLLQIQKPLQSYFLLPKLLNSQGCGAQPALITRAPKVVPNGSASENLKNKGLVFLISGVIVCWGG